MKLSKDKQVIVERRSKVVYDCGDRVVKVFDANKPASDILNEALNQSRAADAGIDVPAVIEVGKVDNNWALSMEKVEGTTLRQLMDANPDKVDEYVEQLVDIEISIHQHRAPLMPRQKDKYARMINSVKEVLGDTNTYEILQRLDGMKNHVKVCHGDFVPSNVILREDGTVCVVDWAHATQGNGSADCATTYLHFMLRGDKDVAEKYINAYCERQGCTRDYVQQWTTIVAAAEIARGRVADKDFLMSMVDVVDYM